MGDDTQVLFGLRDDGVFVTIPECGVRTLKHMAWDEMVEFGTAMVKRGMQNRPKVGNREFCPVATDALK